MLRRLPGFGTIALIIGVAGCTVTATTVTMPDSSAPDSGVPDAGSTVEAEGGTVACALPSPGTPSLLVPLQPGSFYLWGITSDDLVIYESGATLAAVPLAGGAPQTILTNLPSEPGSVIVDIARNVVIIHGEPIFPSGLLRIWTPATGLQTLSTSSGELVNTVAESSQQVSPDGQWVLFTDNLQCPTADRCVAEDLVVSHLDGSAKHVLIAGGLVENEVDGYGCTTAARFMPSGDVLAHACVGPRSPIDAGASATRLTVSVFASTTWAKTELATDVATDIVAADDHQWAFDPAGTQLWLPHGTAPSNGELVSLTGGGTRSIDTNASLGFFDPAGATVFYRTITGGLRRSTVATATAPVELVPNGFLALDAVSPDGQYIAYHSHDVADADGVFYGSDVRLTSATTAGSSTTLLDGSTGGGDFMRFTADSRFGLWGRIPDSKQPVASLVASPTAGGPSRTLSNKTLGSAALSCSAVVFEDTPVWSGSQSEYVVDLRFVDLGGSTDNIIVSRAIAGFQVKADRKKLVYATRQGAPGIYAVSF